MKLIVASLALAGLSSAYVLPGAAPTGAVVRSSSDVVMIGRKNSTPKKAAAKKAEEEKPWGFFDFLQAGRKGGNLELLNPTVYKQLTPEEYDTRSFKANVKPKSGTINKNDASTCPWYSLIMAEMQTKTNVVQVAPVVAVAAPLTDTMERMLGPYDVISVEQTPRGCLQEAFGCTARNEFVLYGGYREGRMSRNIFSGSGGPKEFTNEQIGYMLEESPFFPDRCFWSGMRKLQMPIKAPNQDGEVMLNVVKDFSMPTHCIVHGNDGDLVIPCCCYLPSMRTVAPDGTIIGKAKYVCDSKLFVPKIMSYDQDGNKQYLVRPDTCCADCCPVCECGNRGGNCLYMPFFIRDPMTLEKLPGGPGAQGEPAQIRNLWAGMKKECCTSANHYFIAFPQGVTTATKGSLIAATALLDFTVFEEKDGGCCIVSW